MREATLPIYEYFCHHCQRRFEELCRTSTQSQMPCPGCGQSAKRQFSSFAFASGGVHRSSGGCGGCTSGSCSSCKH
ncbi:MAG: FmdB family zinc ribbon protein [Bacteroidota bacterium]